MPTTTEKAKPHAKEEVIDWINHILAQKKWTGTDLARNADLAPSTILRMLNDPNHHFTPSLRTLKKIAHGSGYPIPNLVLRSLDVGRMEPSNDDDPEQATRKSNVRSFPRVPRLKVRHVSTLPKALHPQSTEEVSVPCPPQLTDDATAFAFYLAESSFEPWFRAGSLVYVTKRRDPVEGDIILVTKKDGRSFVRLVTAITEKGIELAKGQPVVSDMTVPFDDLDDWALVSSIVRA
jgi:transcriptional regulator with XRE-family HTH domain